MKDLKNRISVKQLLEAKSNAAGTLTTSWIDLADAASVVFAINYGVFTPNTATAGVTAKLQESDTTASADATDVAAANVAGTLAGVLVDASNDQRSEWVGYKGNKRYVRLVVVVPADSTSLVCSADAIIGNRDMPISAATVASAT